MMQHPKNKAERRRIKAKKDRLDRFKPERADYIQKRIEQEALEQKEALHELRLQVPQKDEDE